MGLLALFRSNFTSVKRLICILLTLSIVACSSSDEELDSESAGAKLLEGTLELAVEGRGFLVLDNGDDRTFVRSATFSIDGDAQLVTADGRRLFTGYPFIGLDDQGSVSLNDINIGSIVVSENGLLSFFSKSGRLYEKPIILARFYSPGQLTELSPGVFSMNSQSGKPVYGSSGSFIKTQAETSSPDYFLDLETQGEEFFMLESSDQRFYSASSRLQSDKDSVLIDRSGLRLLGYVEANGGAALGSEEFDYSELQPLEYYNKSLVPNMTGRVSLTINLDINAEVVEKDFDFGANYTYDKYVAVFDSLGFEHWIRFYFVATESPSEWLMYYYFSPSDDVTQSYWGEQWGGPYNLGFDSSGHLISNSLMYTDQIILINGSVSWYDGIELNLSGSVLSSAPFSVTDSQDGYGISWINRMAVDECGKVIGYFDNGVQLVTGKVALSQFNNSDELMAAGESLFSETDGSGGASVGVPCENGFSAINGDTID